MAEMCKTRKCIGFLTILFCVSSLAAFAETIPGRWEKVDALVAGRAIIVRMDGGDRVECSFVGSNADSITIRDQEGNEREFPKSGISRIESVEKTGRGRLWDGTLIGAAVGAAVGGITVAAVGSDMENAGGFAAFCVGVGAGVGLAIDAAVGAREVFYRAK